MVRTVHLLKENNELCTLLIKYTLFIVPRGMLSSNCLGKPLKQLRYLPLKYLCDRKVYKAIKVETISQN